MQGRRAGAEKGGTEEERKRGCSGGKGERSQASQGRTLLETLDREREMQKSGCDDDPKGQGLPVSKSTEGLLRCVAEMCDTLVLQSCLASFTNQL